MTSTRGYSSKLLQRRPVLAFLSALAFWLLTFIPPVPTMVKRLDRSFMDLVLRISGGPPERPELVLLGIDDASLGEWEAEGEPVLAMMGKRFPWDRKVWAAVIDRLGTAGAKVIAIDLFLSEPSEPDSDRALAEAIGRHRDQVVLVSAFVPAGGGGEGGDELMYLEPLPEFFGEGPNETRCGFANFEPDADKVIRSVRYRKTLREANLKPAHPDETVYRSFSGEILDLLGKPVPAGVRYLRYSLRKNGGASEVYAPRSLSSIFDLVEWEKSYGGGEFFKDKVVLIGPTAPRFQDLHATPLGVLSGPQLHLQSLGAALNEGFWVPMPAQGGWSAVYAWLAAIWAAVSTRFFKRQTLLLVCAVVTLLGMLIGAWLVFVVFSLHVPVWPAVVAYAGGWVVTQSVDLVSERLARGWLNREFRRFVSRDVADFLVKNPELYREAAAGRRREVAVLFSDVRGFTGRSEQSEPAELVAQLNQYLSRMVTIVFEQQGTLDKFIGDAVMAHWGALQDGDARVQAKQAVEAATRMLSGLDELNRKWIAGGWQPFEIGVGLHYGEVLAGEIGSEDKTEFGVIGDAVNLASRIEGLTKHFQTPLLVSGNVARLLEGENGLRWVGSVRVKGRREAVDLYAPQRGGEKDMSFRRALDLFRKGNFREAVIAFDACLSLDPEDGVARRYLKWASDYSEHPPESWDGTVVMISK